jgi:hypothetical protein
MSISLEREIERRRRRAADLGVDRLISGLFFDHGLRYYLSWSKRPEYVYRSISQASVPELGRLDFTLYGENYSICTKHGSSYDDDEELVELELWENEQLVFSQDVGLISDQYDDMYTPRLTTAFIEGPWIAHFRGLESEVTAVEKRNRQRSDEKHIAAKAARFGIAPSEKSFIAGDAEDAASAVAKAVVVGPFLLAGWLIKVLIPIITILGLIGLLLFGLRQL